MSVLAEPRRLPRGTADAVVRRVFPQPSPYAADPVGFCRDVLRFEPWSKQREILEAVRDNTRTAVRSGHGTGKTALAARAALWFLTAFERSRVITTALTWEQVRSQLWREIHAAYHRAGRLGGDLFETRLDMADGRFALGLSTDKPERFHGHHAENLLLIVDEASGVDERIFEAATGYMTAEGARLLLIGNPTQLAGTFHRAFHADRASWATLSVSVFDTPAFTGEKVPDATLRALPTREWVDDMRRLYGERSPVWEVRVLGEFPSTADNTVCSLSDVEQAQRNDLLPSMPAVVVCDVARFGSDETVIGVRRGSRFRVVDAYAGKATTETAGRVLRTAVGLFDQLLEPVTVVVDDVGVGGGVTDILRERLAGRDQFRIVGFNAGEKARRPEDYPNRRSEVWFGLSERLSELDLDEADEQLVADLVAPRYAIDTYGRRVVEPKADTKKRLGRSPDRGDAAVMAFSVAGPFARVPQPDLARSRELAVSAAFAPLPEGASSLSAGILERPL